MYIRWFKDISKDDVASVGGKNANLGEMFSKLSSKGIPVPNGFALSAEAYWAFMKESRLDKKIKQILFGLDVKNVRKLSKAGAQVRGLILRAEFPKSIKEEIESAYRELSNQENRKSRNQKNDCDVAVRSSATAEDLPEASFAGQQESYLNVRGEKELLLAVKKCVASLFTDRAISYREAKGFDHMAVALSVGVQQMVRSDLATSGVMFTLDTESGFNGVVLINASYGLGEYVVKGRVTPDQFYVFKAGVKQGYQAIIDRRLGSKEVKLVYGTMKNDDLRIKNYKGGTKQEKVPVSEQNKFCLTNEEVVRLTTWGMIIEEHYKHPMDIEWAKDGVTGQLYIVQARSETVRSRLPKNYVETFKLEHRGKVLAQGASVGQRIGQGRVRIINSPRQMKEFKAGEVLVTRITDPDWEPIMRIAAAIVTEQGGKTSHAAIVSRELGIPCVVGAAKARQLVKPKEEVTVSCAEGEVGYVYRGRLPFEVERVEITKLEPTKTKVMMNIADPDRAFSLSSLPNDGVGLAREEFIFTNFIKIHPLALVNYQKIKDQKIKKTIDALTVGYKDKSQYLVDKLAQGMAFIAAAFYPHEVIVRLSDFKTNEYATLIGGKEFEPKEENPMLGWRGASRYYSPEYKSGFKLECAAIKKAREEWGLKNVIVMVPFCRTVEEGKKVLETMKEFGLERGNDGLQVYVMCEIPSNVILAKEFAEIFDGFSIGSNDLTQLTLGVDRDSALVSHIYNENNAAVKKLIREVIQTAHAHKRKVGICGQAPSDYPEFAEFLVQEGIDSISLNPDTVFKTRQRIVEMEKKLGAKAHMFKFSVVSKIMFFLATIGMSLGITGYGCQTAQPTIDSAFIKNEIALETAKARGDFKREFQAQKQAERSSYSADSFVSFALRYPAGWAISSTPDMIRFESSDPSRVEYFSLVRLKKEFFDTGNYSLVTTTWKGYDAVRLDGATPDTPGRLVLRVYPDGFKKSKYMIEVDGNTSLASEILDSIKGFKLYKE